MPLRKIAHATAFTTISDLSFQMIATHNQPATPINCRNILYGHMLLVVIIIATIRTSDDTHLIYQLNGC